jgi:Pentapeptide repeats (9 copies)
MSTRINRSRWLGRWLRPLLADLLFLLLLLIAVLLLVFLVLYLESFITGKSLSDGQSVIQALKDSAILGVVESIAIITSVIIFIFSGRNNKYRQQRYDALTLLDASQALKQSVMVREALESLNQSGEAFRQYSFVEEVDLHGVQLPNVNFCRAKLPKVRFENATLHHADFWDAYLPDAQFDRANLQWADFRNAHLQGSDFTSSLLNNASFLGANIHACIFDAAVIHGADFRKVQNLPKEQIIMAEGWQTAKFDAGVKEELIELAHTINPIKPL